MSHTRGGSFVEGHNVVRKSSKRSRLILGAAVASALAGMTASSVRAADFSWNGSATPPSFWDVGSNWTAAGPPLGTDNAIFGAGAVDFGVDLHAATQVITNVTFNNATGSYLLSNGALNIGGTLTQSGAATNTIGAQVLASGAWNVSGGTLRVTNHSNTAQNNFNAQTITVGAGASLVGNGAATTAGTGVQQGEVSSLHNSNVLLNGGTLVAGGNYPTGANQLLGTYYDTAIDQAVPSVKFSRLLPIDRENGILNMVPDGYNRFTTQVALSDQGKAVGPVPTQNITTVSISGINNNDPSGNPDDFAVGITRTLTVSAASAGRWVFATNSDDGSTLWIDLNHNGKFDWSPDPSQRELIVWNNNDQGPTTRENGRIRGGIPAAHPNLDLAAGDYKFAIGWYEGRVTGSVIAGFHNNTNIPDPLDPTGLGLTFINPSDPNQAGMWSVQNE